MGKKQRTGTAPPRTGAWLANAPPKPVKLPAFLPILPPTDEYFPISEQAEQPPSTLDATGQVRVNDGIGPCVVTASNALTQEECYAWIAFGEMANMPPKPGPDGRYKPGDEPPARPGFKDIQSKRTAGTAERFHGRLSLRDDAAAEAIFRRIRPLLPDTLYGKKPVACNPNLRLYRYSEGQRFGRHVDGAEILPRGRTEFTVLLYLSACEGGATTFFRDHEKPDVLFAFQPADGAVLLHAHGQRCLTHAGAPVTGGVKYLLRTDVVYQ